jgi:hypothetical protein
MPWKKKVARSAAAFLRRYEKTTGRKLDYSLDRVRDLDRYLEKHFRGDPLPEEVVEDVGYYFAELLHRSCGGRYAWDRERGTLAIRKEGISVFPLEKVRRVLQERTPGGLEVYAFLYARKTSGDG